MKSDVAIAIALVACGHAGTVPTGTPPVDPVTPTTTDRVLDVRGVHIAVHVRGTGPTCLVIPGGPGLEWTYLRMAMLETRATLVYIEPVGTGGSSRAPAAELTRERWADDVENVRAALDLDRPCVIGHSYGGYIAQTFALAHPDHVGALVLYDTAPRNDAELGKAIEDGVARFAKEPWFAEASTAMEAEGNAKTDEELTAIFHREAPIMFAEWTRRRGEFEPLVASVHAYVPQGGGGAPFDVRAQLPSLHVRALVIVGKNDAIIGPRFAEELHAALAGSQLVVLERSGHMGHVEEPDAFARAVGDFVTSAPK
jgi:pimeloyl-ACP methyl ester carboxylesterase